MPTPLARKHLCRGKWGLVHSLPKWLINHDGFAATRKASLFVCGLVVWWRGFLFILYKKSFKFINQSKPPIAGSLNEGSQGK